MPEVSVLLPTYNAETTVLAALASLSRQTCQDWECLVCDDGSTDQTLHLVEQFAQRESRIRVFSGEHRGIVNTLNHGLLQCKGSYVARFDADDLMHRQRLAQQLSTLKAQPKLCGVGCAVRMFPRQGLTEGRRKYEAWLNQIGDEQAILRDRFIECPLAHPSLVLRTQVLCEFGYRDMGWPEDYDLILRLLGAGQRLSTVHRRLLFWREQPTRLSRISPTYGLDRFTSCKAHFLASDWLGGSEHYVLWGYGSTGRSLARALLRLGKRPSTIVELHPGRIGQRILSVPVISAHALSQLGRRSGRVILSVAGELPRADARQFADSQGLREGIDYICAA